jgi:hypothetical protein
VRLLQSFANFAEFCRSQVAEGSVETEFRSPQLILIESVAPGLLKVLESVCLRMLSKQFPTT